MTPTLPDKVLAQHIAIVGKTGSGKTCTAKLAIEQVVAEGARVCVLDPIKSDWWGLTSSADGKRPGLPFHILGGPRGHVPLHAQAGAAIGEIVGNGQLPLSILDMADFEMGGLQQFFTHFAPMLLRKMRGVLYLVIEESHEFAPKERGGFGAENMAIHYAKKLAVAGRSKGIRLIIATQRTQALHNALLGSCDTLIAHRLVAPADQEPIVKWLKANLPLEKAKEVAASLQSLKTGEAWICSGELGLFERRQFPRIHTYDNTATPTDDVSQIEVKTAPVDHDRLRTIIGSAVEEAKANDPAELKKRIADLQRELAKKPTAVAAAPAERVEVPIFTADERSMMRAIVADVKNISDTLSNFRSSFAPIENRVAALQERIDNVTNKCVITPHVRTMTLKSNPNFKMPSGQHVVVRNFPEANGTLGKCEMAILRVLANYPDEGCEMGKIALLSCYRVSGGFRNSLSTLRTAGAIEGENMGTMRITEHGLKDYGPFERLPHGDALREHWLTHPTFGACERKALLGLLELGKATMEDLAKYTNYEVSGGFRNALSNLRTAGVIVGKNTGEMRPSDDLL